MKLKAFAKISIVRLYIAQNIETILEEE